MTSSTFSAGKACTCFFARLVKSSLQPESAQIIIEVDAKFDYILGSQERSPFGCALIDANLA